VGLIFAARFPERVRSLAVIASVAHVDERLRQQTEAWVEATRRGPAAAYEAVSADSFSPAFLRANPALVEAGRARLVQAPSGFFPGFTRLVRAFQQLDARPLLPRIACPTLVIAAEGDALKPPSCSRALAEGIPGAELAVVAGSGHAVVLEQPEAVNALLLGFLATRRRR
jgi:pimeloyl-ACP methyl ester carboxylesterase